MDDSTYDGAMRCARYSDMRGRWLSRRRFRPTRLVHPAATPSSPYRGLGSVAAEADRLGWHDSG
eukprot:1751526-Lingulodinium_polyedra.AAC.1